MGNALFRSGHFRWCGGKWNHGNKMDLEWKSSEPEILRFTIGFSTVFNFPLGEVGNDGFPLVSQGFRVILALTWVII